jgi:hypothetical protein
MRKHFLAVVFAAVAGMSIAGCSHAPEITQEQMVRDTQELVDAVAAGNTAPWQKYFADDAMYFDEKGRNMNKAALVKDLTPLPNGCSGTIKIVHPQSRILGNTAILSYDMDETETVFGQRVAARYHATDTWMLRNGTWQIVAGQVLRYYEDPAMAIGELKKMEDFAGTYEMAPGQTITVSIKNHELYAQRGDRTPQQLFQESGDIFFRKGVEGRYIFRRTSKGSVDALIDRRNNEDLVWLRTK